jgi:hypothetical protein
MRNGNPCCNLPGYFARFQKYMSKSFQVFAIKVSEVMKKFNEQVF